MGKAVPFYGLGLLAMLVGVTSTRVSGWTAVAVGIVGLAIFVIGIVVEERSDPRRGDARRRARSRVAS